MHRATPLNTSFRSFSAGGARTAIDQVDDKKQMQEMKGNMMKGETRDQVESPQNYGFSSVVADADKDKDGKMTDSAEGFMGFQGGSRSFPVCYVMDDRRHRMKEMEKGDTAMFRGKDDQQQFHMTGEGGFWSARDDMTVRMQLVPKKQQQQSAATLAAGAAGGGAGSTSQQQKERGQKPVFKDGKGSVYFIDVTKAATRMSGRTAHMMLDDKQTYVHAIDKEVYLGAEKGKATFAKVLTESGPSLNVYAKVG